MKKYIIIAGVNGAGKSTLYQMYDEFKDMPRINVDELVRDIGDWKNVRDVFAAGKIAVRNISKYLEAGITFNQETTLCGNSIIRNIMKAKENGYFIELHYVGLESAEIAKERVNYRVERGGHGIPEADIERRYVETFIQLNRILKKCDLVALYDNSVKFRRFAIYKSGMLVSLSQNVPKWFLKIDR